MGFIISKFYYPNASNKCSFLKQRNEYNEKMERKRTRTMSSLFALLLHFFKESVIVSNVVLGKFGNSHITLARHSNGTNEISQQLTAKQGKN